MPGAGQRVAVRDARLEDCPAIAVLLSELGYPTTARSVERRLAILQRSRDSRILVAVNGPRAVGVTGLHIIPLLHRDWRLGRILVLAVSREFARQGIGRQLIGAVEKIARDAGCRRLELTTAAERAGAHAFYRKFGFEEASKRFAKTLELHRGRSMRRDTS